MLRYFLAVLHLLTFGLGTYSCWARASSLKMLKNESDLPAVFRADNLWGVAAFLWLATGTWRAFGGIEKGTSFYLHDTAFIVKMSLFLTVFLLEIYPMVTLIRWRINVGRKVPIDLVPARRMSVISYVELGLLVPIVAMAAAMARGIWY